MYARSRSYGVSNLATIDRRQVRPVYTEITGVIQQAKTLNNFAQNVIPRALRPGLSNASMFVQVYTNY